ncbi:MAG: hypothetical protein NT164_01170 [Verrucomicrobiae bacterium]|nr:hypothetical protein [Verrucomicrobiae bacterium]
MEAQHPETKEWQPSERFEDTTGTWKFAGLRSDPNDLQPLSVVTKHYNRAEDIDKRKAAYEQELREEQIKNPSPESEHRIFALGHLISVLEKASAYQNEMVRHLNASESPDARITASQDSYRLKTFSKINESPNQLERIADQIEIDSQNLLSYQATLNIIQAHILALPTPGGFEADCLNSMKSHGEDAIAHQRNLITAKEAYATALPPPYEPRDEATQAGINQRALEALDCRREAILVRQNNGFIHATYPTQNLRVALYGQHEVEARQQVEKENQRAQPRQQVIDWFTQSADLYQQAAAAQDAGNSYKALSLEQASLFLERPRSTSNSTATTGC